MVMFKKRDSVPSARYSSEISLATSGPRVCRIRTREIQRAQESIIIYTIDTDYTELEREWDFAT